MNNNVANRNEQVLANRKKILIAIIILFVTAVLSYMYFSKEKFVNLADPRFILGSSSVSPTPSVTPKPPQAPETFQFDSSTDLKAELEKIQPEVLESDFE